MREIRDVTVGELMSKPPVTVTPETSIADLRRLLAEHDKIFTIFMRVSDRPKATIV